MALSVFSDVLSVCTPDVASLGIVSLRAVSASSGSAAASSGSLSSSTPSALLSDSSLSLLLELDVSSSESEYTSAPWKMY